MKAFHELPGFLQGGPRRALFALAATAAWALAPAAPAGAQAWPPYPGTQPVKSASPSPEVMAGGTITWTITIHNDAFDGEAAVSLYDDVPDPADGLPVQPWSLADLIVTPPFSTPVYSSNDRLNIDNINIPGRGTETVVFRTRVNGNAPDGTVICNRAWLLFTVIDCSGNPPLCSEENYTSGTVQPDATAGPTCVTVRAPAPGVNPNLGASAQADSCPVDAGFPAPDGVVSPGETLTLTLAVHNTGTADAGASPRPITGTIQPGPGYSVVAGSSAYDTTVRRDVLLANSANVGTNLTPFVVRIDPDVACPSVVEVVLVLSNIAGGPYTVRFPYEVGGASGAACIPRCLDVRLRSETPALRDTCGLTPPGSNGGIDPGEDVYLRLPVTNNGSDALRGAPTITGTLTSRTVGVSVLAGADTSAYPDLLPGTTETSLSEFGIHVDAAQACNSRIDLDLTLTGSDGGTRVVTYRLAVASPCTVCSVPACTPSVSAVPQGPTRICEGGSVLLDAQGSSLGGCTGALLYQWLQGGSPVAGATAPTYDATGLAAGSHSFTVLVTCSTNPSCSGESLPVPVTVDPPPLVVRSLLAVRSGIDVQFSWPVEPTASGGYNLYWTANKTLLDAEARGTPANPEVFLVGSTPTAADTTFTHAGAVSNGEPRMYYQLLAVCSDGATEGPNE